MITSIEIENFKSILGVKFEPGMVNVFIGPNGSGKSALLEAIGVLSAAINDRVEDASLKHRGVRLGTPALFKSSFKDLKRLPLTIGLGIGWKNSEGQWDYKVNLNNPIDDPKPSWEYYSEKLSLNREKVFGRSRATTYKLENFPEIEIDKFRGLLSFLRGIKLVNNVNNAEDLYTTLSDYAVYTPNTSTLRGIYPDPTQREPIGLLGGRLPEAVDELLDLDKELYGSMDLNDLLELIDWVASLTIGKPTKELLPTNVPSTQKVIRFTDRFMREGRNELTSYDASEGSLFVLFVLALAMHHNSPKMFAIDNFDQAMNPRLARRTAKTFCQEVINNKKIAFITTHNPLVLDGLDLNDDRIRLFTVDRDKQGHTKIKRVEVTEELLQKGKEGHTLSRLWVMGRLGGVPNI